MKLGKYEMRVVEALKAHPERWTTVLDLARRMKATFAQARNAVKSLQDKGMVEHDVMRDRVTLK